MKTDAEKARMFQQTLRMKLLPHQQRVVEEKRELDEKREKLSTFMGTPTYAALDVEERMLLVGQRSYMRGYSITLGDRIARFNAITTTKLEQALIDLTTATDGQGLRIVLFYGAPEGQSNAQALREDTYRFMANFDREAVFLNGLDPKAPQGPAEAAAWRNLALLARATAAAIEEEGR